MEAKKISQRAVKSMINCNTVLLHIGNFETGKRTNLRRAVDECVYASRLFYNTELQSDQEKSITYHQSIMISCLRLSYTKHILQRLMNTLSTTFILTIQASITHWL